MNTPEACAKELLNRYSPGQTNFNLEWAIAHQLKVRESLTRRDILDYVRIKARLWSDSRQPEKASAAWEIIQYFDQEGSF